MKKLFTIALAIMITCVFSFSDTGAAYAAGNALGTIGQPEVPQSITGEKKAEYVEGEALVMFRTTEKLSKSKAKKSLTSGLNPVDLDVKNLWSFSSKANLVKNSSGKKKFVALFGKTDKYAPVALVRSGSLTTEQLVKKLKARKDVLYAEPNYKIHALSLTNDTYFKYQWSMQDGEDNTPNVSYQWEEKKTKGSDNIVAVVDTGIDYTHPDLKGMMWENDHYPQLKGECGYNFIAGTGDPLDDNGHGTHCAGIIGASGNNGEGISGVNQKIRLMALKILDEEGSSSMSHEIAAYNYINTALELGEPVKVINNSWGGGAESDIFRELADLVGSKGAVTVCAAGNESSDNDEEPTFPANTDSPYVVSVAATKEDGKIVSFSNYGKKTVDVAAPGADILSTVSYNSYNPTIYDDKQGEISDEFNDYSAGESWGVPVKAASYDPDDPSTLDAENIYYNGEKVSKYLDELDKSGEDPKYIPEVTVTKEGSGFLGDNGSYIIDVKKMQPTDLLCFAVPYEVDKNNKDRHFSIMAQPSGPVSPVDIFFGGGSLFAMLDLDADTKLDTDTLGDQEITLGTYVTGERDHWSHFDLPCDKGESTKKMAVVLLYASDEGDFQIKLDDIGLSKQIDTDKFGKYDFMSGTSMAAPYFSGSVALKAAELGKDLDSESLINETVSMAKTSPVLDNILMKGSFDFTKRPTELGPRLGTVTVDQDKKTISISGSGLKPSGQLKVEFSDDLEDPDTPSETAEIVENSDRKVVVKDKKWINNIKSIRVTGANGKSFDLNDVYLVKGKKEYTPDDSFNDVTGSDPITTDGKRIFYCSSAGGNVESVDVSNFEDSTQSHGAVQADEVFGIKQKKTADYSMSLGNDLVYCNDNVYCIMEYGMSEEPEGEDFFFWKNDASNYAMDTVVYDGDGFASDTASIYAGQLRLVRFNAVDEEVEGLGSLPSDLEKTADWAVGAYNGKLYFAGGYSFQKGKKGLTTAVKIYDPKTQKWSDGTALPEARAGGKLIQTGDKLVYTLGYSKDQKGKDLVDQKIPANLIFDGKTWKKSKVSLDDAVDPHILESSVNRGGDEYLLPTAGVSLAKDGILYTGMPSANLGDTFVYDVAKDSYRDTGYNFINYLFATEIKGISVDKKIYGFDGADMFTAPVESGFVHVDANKKGKGKGSFEGAGAYVPGNDATITVKAGKYHRIKSLTVDGKKQKLGKKQRTKNVTLNVLLKDKKIQAEFVKYKVKVKIKKKGKGTVKGGKTYVAGSTAKIKVKAKKGYYIKSIKVGKKTIKVKKKATKKTFKIKKMAKDQKVTVVFKKKGK